MDSDHEEIEIEFFENEENEDESKVHTSPTDAAPPKEEAVQPKEEVEEIEQVENIEPVQEPEKPAIEKVESWDGIKKPPPPPELEDDEKIDEIEAGRADIKVNPKVATRPDHHAAGGFHDTFVGGNVATPNQAKAITALKQDEQKKIDEENAKKKVDADKEKRRKLSRDSDSCLVSLVAWLYSLIACCNPLLPPPKKRNRSSTRDREVPPLGEMFYADSHIREMFADVEYMIKECYVQKSGSGNIDNLKLTVISYRILKSAGFNYFTKIKVNNGEEFIHARIFKGGKGKAMLMGDLQLGKTEGDEITQF